MNVDLDVPIKFKGKPIEGATLKDILFQILSNYGGFTGELKAGISHILGKVATAEEEVELNRKELSQLRQAWNKVCDDENFRVPLIYDEPINDFLKDKVKHDG